MAKSNQYYEASNEGRVFIVGRAYGFVDITARSDTGRALFKETGIVMEKSKSVEYGRKSKRRESKANYWENKAQK